MNGCFSTTPNGSYSEIQHLLADSWSKLQLAEVTTPQPAQLYKDNWDRGDEANAGKPRANEACVEACERAVRVYRGMVYAEEYNVPRYWRESSNTVLAPVSNELIKSDIGTNVLGLPMSY